MLDFMRRNANSWIMVIIFAVIIFVFAINFGPWAGNIKTDTPYAAIVNNEIISLAEFRSAYTTRMARMKQLRPKYDQEQAEKDQLKRAVLDQLIARELMTQLAKKYDVIIGPKVLAQEIKSRVFGPDEPFDQEEYKRRIRGFLQVSIAQFEEQVKKELLAQQMGEVVDTAVYISEEEAKKDFINKNTQVSLDYVQIDPEYFEVNNVSKEQINTFINANEERIAGYYNENLSKYQKDKEVRASHILLKVDAKTNEAEKKKAKEKAEEILRELVTDKADFATMAKKYSEDEASKNKGGDLGFFSHGMMVEEFSDVAFELGVSELSNVIETPFGYHIIKVTDIKEAEHKSLEDVNDEIAKILLKKDIKQQKAKDFAGRALAQLKSKKDLEAINLPGLHHKKRGGKEKIPPKAPIKGRTARFNLSTSFIGEFGRADKITAAISTLNEEGEAYDDIIEQNNKYYVIRVSSYEPADMEKFAEQKDQIISRMSFMRRRSIMEQFFDHLKSKANITYNKALY